ncbi:hypothetical protein TNCV_3420731 [Trichonephila clavipes]|nr:hypothetical protein TNCV_3420731 [Trichonephila clavipes]
MGDANLKSYEPAFTIPLRQGYIILSVRVTSNISVVYLPNNCSARPLKPEALTNNKSTFLGPHRFWSPRLKTMLSLLPFQNPDHNASKS